MLGSNNRLIGNCLPDNGQYGFNAYSADGVIDVISDGNEITGNNTDDWESRQPGCRCTRCGKFWATNSRPSHLQLYPRQLRCRPLGGLQRRRISLWGQLRFGVPRRRYRV